VLAEAQALHAAVFTGPIAELVARLTEARAARAGACSCA
jgi:hypothetical protein